MSRSASDYLDVNIEYRELAPLPYCLLPSIVLADHRYCEATGTSVIPIRHPMSNRQAAEWAQGEARELAETQR
jgi:hypothetical protein